MDEAGAAVPRVADNLNPAGAVDEVEASAAEPACNISYPFGSTSDVRMEVGEEEDEGFQYSHARRVPRTMTARDAEESEGSSVLGAAALHTPNGDNEEEEEAAGEEEEESKRRLLRLVGLYPRHDIGDENDSEETADDNEEEEEEEDEEEEDEEEEEEGTRARGSARVPTMDDLFISDSEDEDSREAMRRRHAVFLRTRSDGDQQRHNTDRNAQEVVARRMRLEYKPANNRTSLLWPNPEDVPNGKREMCLPLLLRRRELGGLVGGRHGSRSWNASSFTREVRRSSYMLRRLRRRSSLATHSGCVNALHFSPGDGNLIASGSDDQQIAISDWMREKCLTKFDSGHETNVFQTRFLHGSHHLLLASSARDGMVRLSTLNTSGDLVTSKLLFHHNDSCNKVTVHPDEPFSVMSCAEDAAVVHIDIREPDNHRLFRVYDEAHSSPVPLYSIAGHPLRSHEFCVCGRNPVVRVFDRRAVAWTNVGTRYTSAHRDSSDDHSAPVQQFCAFEQHGPRRSQEKPLWRSVEADGDAMETQEEPEREREEPQEEEENGELRRRGASDATGAATRPEEGTVASDAVVAFLVNLHVTSAVYSHNGDAILCSYNDADLFLFDTKPGREAHPSHKYCGQRNNTTVKCCNFYGPNSEYILTGSDCGNIFFFSRESEEIANFQTGDHLGVVNVLEPHPSLPVLATSGLDSDVKIWTPEWSEELDEVNMKRWPFEEKILARTVLENWMDHESAKTMMVGQSALLRMLRIALQRRHGRDGPMDTGDNGSDSDDDNDDDVALGGGAGLAGGGGAGGGDSDDENDDDEGSRAFRRRDFCVQS